MLRSIVDGHTDDGDFRATLSDGNTVRSRACLVATGVDWRRLEVPGVDSLLHAGVYYGAAASEGPGVAGKTSSSSVPATRRRRPPSISRPTPAR